MARNYPHSHLCHGFLVGFSVKKLYNDPCFYACFRSKDGRRMKRDTNKMRMNDAVEAARIIIEEEYAPVPERPERVTWEQAIELLKGRMASSGNRASTLGYYLKLIRLVRKLYPNTDPCDISPSGAQRWRDWMMTSPGRRKKLPSAHYVAGLLVGLSALWKKWFMEELNILPGNPWEDVTPPKTDKLPVKYATDEMLEHFYAWLRGRFGNWEFPTLFLAVKAYSGCRLMDLCSLPSSSLQNGRLVFPPSLVKGRKERSIPLDNELSVALDAFKGKTWLWENYIPGLKRAVAAKGWPVHQLKGEFTPRRLYNWVETLFADYRKAFPERPVLTTHMLRKRAFTLAWQAGVDVRHASIAYGCNVDTIMRHYVCLDEKQVTDAVFEKMKR